MREAIVVSVAYYIDGKGRRPFIDWVESLDPDTAEMVHYAVEKRRVGNTGGSKPVGGGVHELKAKGFSIYYGIHGDKLIILLAGGRKRRQQADINVAKSRWRNFRQEPRKWARGR